MSSGVVEAALGDYQLINYSFTLVSFTNRMDIKLNNFGQYAFISNVKMTFGAEDAKNT